MIKADFHTHTSFSSDSTEPPENMIKQAIHLGLETICITDHYDYLFPEQYKDRSPTNPISFLTACHFTKN